MLNSITRKNRVYTYVTCILDIGDTSRILAISLYPYVSLYQLANHMELIEDGFRHLQNNEFDVLMNKISLYFKRIFYCVPQVTSSSFFFFAHMSWAFSANRSAIFCISLLNVKLVMSNGFGW